MAFVIALSYQAFSLLATTSPLPRLTRKPSTHRGLQWARIAGCNGHTSRGAMGTHGGRGQHLSVRQVGNCKKILVIQPSSPASPLQNIDKTLVLTDWGGWHEEMERRVRSLLLRRATQSAKPPAPQDNADLRRF